MSIEFSFLIVIQIIIYALFVGVLAYIILRFIDHLKLFFENSVDYNLNTDINKDINVVISDVSEYVKKISSSEISYTKREKEILNLIFDGFMSAQIADKLFISISTVNTHRQNLIKKNNVKNTTSLLKLLKKEY